jgi:uncharacterized membrane protein YeiH
MNLDQHIIYALDLIGTAAFALSGAVRGLERKPDFIGITILAGATAVGGGMIRDVVLGHAATMLHDVNYLLVILAAALIGILFPALLRRRKSFLAYFDAVGLGIFSAIGASLAWQAQLNPLAVVFVAAMTGAGGGVIRDILMNEMPMVLYREIYISAVVVGAGVLLLVRYFGGGDAAGFLAAMTVTMLIRILAIRLNWSLPRVG